jgi:hypothetical protein
MASSVIHTTQPTVTTDSMPTNERRLRCSSRRAWLDPAVVLERRHLWKCLCVCVCVAVQGCHPRFSCRLPCLLATPPYHQALIVHTTHCLAEAKHDGDIFGFVVEEQVSLVFNKACQRKIMGHLIHWYMGYMFSMLLTSAAHTYGHYVLSVIGSLTAKSSITD